MLTTRRFQRKYGKNICRRCIIDETNCMNLTSRDCIYLPGKAICPACNWNQHIVKRFRLSGKIKMIGK